MDFQLDEDFIKAAEFVLAEYLSKPYDDKTAFPSGDPFREGGREKGFSREYIDRPIHGLVHTLRTIAYTPV
ncbi:MAG: SidE phosphodiesterase domain-containing protein, partial [Candidatus Berkiella sp.]